MTPDLIAEISRNDVEGLLLAALETLISRDAFLLASEAREEAVSHRLAVYLEALLPAWHVDTEYNRQGLRPKYVHDAFGRRHLVRPDIVVHTRNSDRANLLVIEMKKSATAEVREIDLEKLRWLMHDPVYGYRHGVFIDFRSPDGPLELVWV